MHFFTLRAAFFAFDISCNAGWKLRSHAERMAAYWRAAPELALVAGFALQFAGAVLLLLLLDLHRHLSNLIVNCGVGGGLLLVAAI